MIDVLRIARLEALLARVRARALEPRASLTAEDEAPPKTEAQPAPRERAPTPPLAPRPSPVLAPVLAPQAPRPASSLFTTTLVSPPRPSPAPAPAPAPAPPPTLARPPTPTELELPRVELRESRQRLIAAKAIDDDGPHLEETSMSMMAADEAHELTMGESEYLSDAELEVIEGEPEHESDDEPVPSSSRRPTGPEPIEQLEKEIFASAEDVAELPPRHTPPPDSGKLPKASDLPPTIEDFEVGDVTGVHAAPLNDKRVDLPIEPMMEDLLARSGEHGAREASDVDFSPDVTRAALSHSDEVAQIVGEARRFAPATFGDLLDATLSL